jgi:hypothetical protein
MRKGLTLTLMTVALAMISAQARAMAPTILDIPSPIVGSAEPVTGGGTLGNFVYLDAMDLDTLATDDVTAPSNLMWTYSGSGALGTSNYLINGVQPINVGPGGVDPTSPTTSMLINRNDLDPAPGKDAFKNTITIRNKSLSPISGTGVNPGVTGIVAGQTQLVTFFCSDGNAFSSSTVFFYTDANGNDRLSGLVWKIEKTDKISSLWATNPDEWAPTPGTAADSNNITRALTTSGLCLSGTLTGSNYGSVVSPYGYFTIASNQVYRIKMKMSSTQANGMNMPFWDVVLENWDNTVPGGKGLNLYIADQLIFANEGGANALTSAGGTVTWYWCPPAIATTQWKDGTSGAFTQTREALNDPRLRFRLMDVNVPGSNADLKSGSVCIQEIEIASASISKVQVQKNLVNITSLVDHGTTGGNVEVAQLTGTVTSQVAFSNGVVTLTPVGSGQTLDMPYLRPATDTAYSEVTTTPGYQDNFPITWVSDKILRLQVGVSAPDAASEQHPWDAVVLSFQTMTNEINAESYQTSSQSCGSPRQGAAQTYTMFFYTGKETASPADSHRLRWMVRPLNHPAAFFPSGNSTTDAVNVGKISFHSVRVDEVLFKQ